MLSITYCLRGAYCVMIAIDLLGLSKELPEDATARESGHNTFESGLAEYISTCQYSTIDIRFIVLTF